MNHVPVLILGGGPAGLTLALSLQDRGVESRVLEKSSSAGGLARSFKIGPYTFDHSGHLLHTQRPEVLELVRRRLGVRLQKIVRRSVCYVDGGYIPFPYQHNLFYLNAERTREALRGFFTRRKVKPRQFREWLAAGYGDGVGRQFLYPYNHKLWNVDLRKMDVDWVPRFLPSSDAREILKSAFYREKESWGYNAVFYYPAYGGIGTIGCRLAETVAHRTSLDVSLRSIDLERKRVLLADGTCWSYNRLVSTIPLPDFLRFCGLPCPPVVRATGVTVFNVGLSRPFPHEFHWCYVPQPDIPFYRFGVYSNISRRSAPRGHTALYIECASPPKELGQFTFSAVRRHLLRMGLIQKASDVDTVQRLDLRTAYPVPMLGLSAYRRRLTGDLRRCQVELLGRFGAWKYVAISDVMVEAGQLARRLE